MPRPRRQAASVELAVDVAGAIGADSLVHGQTPGGGAAPALTVRVEGAIQVAVGDPLHLLIAPERIHLSDAGNGCGPG